MGSVVQNSTLALRCLTESQQPFHSVQRKLANIKNAIRPTQANELEKKTRQPQPIRASVFYCFKKRSISLLKLMLKKKITFLFHTFVKILCLCFHG